MVDARDPQCPLCGKLHRVWHQVGAASVMCPYGTAEVALDGRAFFIEIANEKCYNCTVLAPQLALVAIRRSMRMLDAASCPAAGVPNSANLLQAGAIGSTVQTEGMGHA